MSATLEHRHQKVLFAIIARYVETGQPVSSLMLGANPTLQLSTASLRRIMNELTARGLLIQPHTSSGRIPSDQGFRAFVSELRSEDGPIDRSTEEALKSAISDSTMNGSALWQRTVRLLSLMSRQAALVITPAISDAVLRHLHFVPLDRHQVLAVIVTRDGFVQNAYINMDHSLSSDELEKIHNYLAQTISGRSLNDIRAILRDELADAISARDAIREKAATLSQFALEIGDGAESKLVVDGRSRLLEQPELEGRLASILVTLERKNRILDMLDQAARTDKGPMVIIGDEGGDEFSGCALISATFGAAGSQGQVGLLGSSRMNYPTLLPLVSLSARLISAALTTNE